MTKFGSRPTQPNAVKFGLGLIWQNTGKFSPGSIMPNFDRE